MNHNYPLSALRASFPILQTRVQGHPLIYLDNAATTQKPLPVLEAIMHYYRSENANVHRGMHHLSTQATNHFEAAREYVQQFLNARHRSEIIFTKGTTEAINLVAQSWGGQHLSPGDEVLISAMEHHANLVPWQLICQQKKAQLRVIPLQSEGEVLDLSAYTELLSSKTKLVALAHASNALGRINPIAQMIKQAHQIGATVLIDGAQAIPHMPVDVQALGADFYAFSAHKVYGPMGIGVLYGKKAILEAMPPYQSGGEMIQEVQFTQTTFNELPYKFEAGTPNVAGAIGMKAALQWIQKLGYEDMSTHEEQLLVQCSEELQKIPGLRLFAVQVPKVPICSFVVEGVHTFDIGQLLDAKGIALRTGHHCTEPLMGELGVESTLRASFAAYNDPAEINYFIQILKNTLNTLR